MDIGKFAVGTGLVASIAAIVLYALSLRGSRATLWAARTAFAVTALSVFVAFGRLMFLVSHHRFEYIYVFDYSSTDLGFPWKYAATWAGQEGSFLLWAAWTAIIGGLLVWKSGKWENRVMPFYITTLAFLCGILVWLSPFNVIHRGSGQFDYPLGLPWPPLNGKGLNPSLQNYWMAIHPPTIFFGFSSLLVPFSFALAAMIWKDYKSWAQTVMPYVLLTVATLGVGLFMGGYWAYETQGWHGFWAWDPVENASLFPWLGALGLLHGLVVQKSRGGMGRSNIFLSIAAWLLFLWGTYLTRSGALRDFSVHAFDMLGKDALMLLKWMGAVQGLAGFGLLIWRWRTIPGRPISDRVLSRDTAMTVAVSIMMMAAAVVCVATSWPLIAHKAAQPIFYNKFSAAILIPTFIVLGAVPFLAWGRTNAEKFLWKVLTPWLAAVGVGALIVWFVWGQEAGGFKPATPRMLVVAIGMLGMFAAIANVMLAARLVRRKTALTLGGWLAHVGFSLVIVGAVLTNVYEQTQPYVLVEGDAPTRTPFGYSLQLIGWTDDGLTGAEQEKAWHDFNHAMKIKVTPNDQSGVAHADDGATFADDVPPGGYMAHVPVFIQHNMASNQDPNSSKYMVWPSIHKELLRDFYIVPATDPEMLRPFARVAEGQTVAIRNPQRPFVRNDEILYSMEDTGYRLTYQKFYMHGGPGQVGTAMGADMVVTAPDGRRATIHPEMRLTEQGMAPVSVQIPELNAACRLKGGIDPATKQLTVEFELPEAGPHWSAAISVTNKPLINVVWLGVLLTALGTLCAMARRALEARSGTPLEPKWQWW